MKIVLLAGGLGTRLAEETTVKPKPMVEIGGYPILWHIMKIYSQYGFNDFIICLGYKGFLIKEYFYNYYLHKSDVTINLADNSTEIHRNLSEPWKITLVDTGLNTLTGGRLKRVQKYVGDETFMMTYGDGVADVNVPALIDFHKGHKQIATLTAVQPTGRFGALQIDPDNTISVFKEKPTGDGTWVNGGFFVLEPKVFDYIEDDATMFERAPLENLARDGQLNAYHHQGFWMPMDKLSDKHELEKMWSSGSAPWKIWND
ncbi:MAG: glucose-1-phosphate cytidylyltransferase [Ignavibacteria bacterium]|nr:glucose-1-phosphate cytidylyltransferase [Ignavibacteria bacterium]